MAIAFALSVAACGGSGTDDGGGKGGSAGVGGIGGDPDVSGGGGEGGEGGSAGSGGGAGGEGGAGGDGGGAGEGGVGGAGGSEPDLCRTDDDCEGLATAQCTVAVCNDGSHEGPIGSCVVVVAEAGASCDDGLFCTVNDVCDEAGQCVGGGHNDCGMEGTECAAVVCDEALGQCLQVPVEDGTACEAGSLCDVATCQAGACVERPKDCSGETSACTAGVCDPEDGSCVAAPLDAGSSCSLGELGQCAVAACDGLGACMPLLLDEGTPCSIPGLGQCEVAACDGAGSCGASPVDAGTSCSIPGLGQCQVAACDGAGACESENLPAGTGCTIPGLGSCQVASCDAGGACAPQDLADGTACDDFNGCTVADACVSGACVGTLDEPACLAAAELFGFGFEDCDEWTLSGGWQCGSPESGPEEARTGAGVLATNLTGTYPPSMSFAGMTATSPQIDLTTAASPALEFWAWVDTERNYDGFNVKARRVGEQAFTILPALTFPYGSVIDGQEAWSGRFAGDGWRKYAVSLADFAGSLVELQFGFRSDGGANYAGVYVDDLRIAEDYVVPVALSRSTLADAFVNVPYEVAAWKTGGPSRIRWSIVGGTDHGWLSIDPNTGVLSGTPVAEGPFTVTVRAESAILSSNHDRITMTGVVGPDPGHVLRDGLEASCDGWTLGGDWGCG
ncbi:MAG TPA: putative Ig domain-containing protein, partial [Vulgatibacter sp.]